MTVLYPLSNLMGSGSLSGEQPGKQADDQSGKQVGDGAVTYWYEGICPQQGKLLQLPRTLEIEAIARHWMQELAGDRLYAQEGKMYGILLVETPSGELSVLKAFSGLLQGQSYVEGWVPPIAGRDRVALEEALTLEQLNAIKQEILTLEHLPERQQGFALSQQFEQRLQELALYHRQRKEDRQHQRQILMEILQGESLVAALEQLDDQSRRDGLERRRLKSQRDAVLEPLQHYIEQADIRMRELKRQRKTLSRQLQAQMHAAYSLTNFAGNSLSLQQLMPSGIPTGTGDCCAPKLLHYAATHALKPLAMAEFWWGPPSVTGDKVQGEFYGACGDRCQPLMGFLLSGLPSANLQVAPIDLSLSILYEDQWLIAVNKPTGLLSVPGRYSHSQDSVLSRLQHLKPDGNQLLAVHRLDQDTSGILLLARDQETHRQLSQQFEQRRVYKVYEAILAGLVTQAAGVIELPLWSDPGDRPYQKVDPRGKPSITRFQVLSQVGNLTRIEFIPETGRTHQLRVHAADLGGLGVAVWGDRLYGDPTTPHRLHLHARELKFRHPQTSQELHLKAATPF